MEIAFTAGEQVRAALGRIGRTEDCSFAPDGRRIAIAGLLANRILVAEVESEPGGGGASAVRLPTAVEIESAALAAPHGVAWLDDSTLAVANRGGGITLFGLPGGGAEGAVRLEPMQQIAPAADSFVETPGSLSARDVGLDLVELVLCSNYAHYVSRQLLDRRRGFEPVGGARLAAAGLEVPDGIAYCPSGRWVAVSNHYRQCVFVYRNDVAGGTDREPAGVLRGVDYPHGLDFAPDGTALFVADAGAPFVRLYRSGDGDWAGEREPDRSIWALDEESFRRGRANPEEGGPKGVSVRSDGRLMATSCETRPLAFFDLAGLGLPPARPRLAAGEAEEAARAALLGCLAAAQERIGAAAESARRQGALRAEGMAASRSWRITAPLRRAGSALRRIAGAPTEAPASRD